MKKIPQRRTFSKSNRQVIERGQNTRKYDAYFPCHFSYGQFIVIQYMIEKVKERIQNGHSRNSVKLSTRQITNEDKQQNRTKARKMGNMNPQQKPQVFAIKVSSLFQLPLIKTCLV